jgi:hypothetical protein
MASPWAIRGSFRGPKIALITFVAVFPLVFLQPLPIVHRLGYWRDGVRRD